MAKVIQDVKMQVPIASLYSVITDFTNYPKFLTEVVGAKIERENPTQVQFDLEVIKRFQYTLEFDCKKNKEVSWKLLSSNFFKKNEGIWFLQETGPNSVDVHYELNLEMGFFVPSMMTKKLTELNLPIMFKAFEAEAKKRS